MKSWPVQDAKSRFSEFLKASLTEGPQVVTLRGGAAGMPRVALGGLDVRSTWQRSEFDE